MVKTAAAEYWLDKNAGGFSRLIDRAGRDWIAFHKEPLNKNPDSVAAGFRGLPNAVFGKENPDAGVGHPGFDKCESTLVSSNVIRTVSKSGRWAWTWTFTEASARLKFEQNDPERAYWFLYEGPPAGRFSPTNQFWGTDLGGPNFDVPDSKAQRFGQWRWAYFGDRAVPRVLAVAQVEADTIEDTFWYLGSSNGGAATANGVPPVSTKDVRLVDHNSRQADGVPCAQSAACASSATRRFTSGPSRCLARYTRAVLTPSVRATSLGDSPRRTCSSNI